MLRRVPRNGGFWQGVTGAPELGEPDEDAAAREVREETGFEVEVEPLGYGYQFGPGPSWPRKEQWHDLYGPGVDLVTEETFAAEVPDGLDPALAPAEHDDFRWCSFDEAETLLKFEENRVALRVLGERLGL